MVRGDRVRRLASAGRAVPSGALNVEVDAIVHVDVGSHRARRAGACATHAVVHLCVVVIVMTW